MPPIQVSCADCSESFTTTRKNAKYCPACRLYRDLTYIKDTVQECWACDEKFSPTKRGQNICAPCGEHQHPHRGHCSFCAQDDRPLLMAGLAICTHCAFDKTNRRRLTKSAAKRVAAQKLANQGVPCV